MLDIDETIQHFSVITGDVAKELAQVGDGVERLKVDSKTKDLDRLPIFSRLSFVSASNIGDQEFLQVCLARQISHLALTNLAVSDFRPLRQLKNLQALSIFHFTKAASFDGFEALTKLEYLTAREFYKDLLFSTI